MSLGKVLTIRSQPFPEKGDGVEPYGEGAWLITDWVAGKLLYVSDAGDAQTLLTLSQGAADHTLIPSESLVVIPMMNDGKVVAYRMTKP